MGALFAKIGRDYAKIGQDLGRFGVLFEAQAQELRSLDEGVMEGGAEIGRVLSKGRVGCRHRRSRSPP